MTYLLFPQIQNNNEDFIKLLLRSVKNFFLHHFYYYYLKLSLKWLLIFHYHEINY